MECGTDDFELDHFETHEYLEFEAYFGQRLVLCDFCEADFPSYDPTYFGFPIGKRLHTDDWKFIQRITGNELQEVPYCPKCTRSLAFTSFIATCRSENRRTNL